MCGTKGQKDITIEIYKKEAYRAAQPSAGKEGKGRKS
jgi:hypothetical protein